MAADGDVVDPQQGRPSPGQPEQSLEADRVVEVAADREQPARKASMPDSSPSRSAQPRRGVGGDGDVGLAPAWRRCARARRGSVQRTSQVWPRSPSSHMVRGVEVAVGAEVAVGERPEGRFDATATQRAAGGRLLGARRVPYPRRPGGSATDRYCCRSLRTITLHDTLSGQVRQLSPANRPRRHLRVRATVYARIHVGNARPFVVFSLLKRFLVHEGYNVTFVANITDINDKIYAPRSARAFAQRPARAGDGRGLHR